MNQSELLSRSRDFLTRSHNLKKEDILALREIIVEHNKLYYQSESPIISDTEYDELFHSLARAESDYDMLDGDSPTARLAILASEQFQKVKHVYPMISLDNTYTTEEVREFEWRIQKILQWNLSTNLSYYIQPKYDGLGLAVIYEYGKIKQAITRGSGVEGEDVTLTALEIENIPKNIKALESIERMEIRGEVMLSRTEFDRINKERLENWEKLFANPRNCASWSLRQLDPLITRARRLRFFAYSLPQIEQAPRSVMSSATIVEPRHLAQENIEQDCSTTKITDTDFLRSKWQITTFSDLMNLLASWGFEREDFTLFHISWLDLDGVVEILEEETRHRREHFDFDIDGMVLKLDDMTLWDELGRTEHHPRYAIAYKFPAKQVRTQVISIEHSVGRTGTVTPVANLEGIEVSGVIVRRATLHNYDELTKKWVREGDYVFIMRAGEVIPEIVSVLTELRDGSEKIVKAPEFCPICSTRLEQDEWKVAIYCPNKHCPAKIQGELEMFVWKQGFNIDGLGIKQIELFLELGWITDFVSVFHLSKYREQFLELEGYQEKSVNNLLAAIEKSRHTTLDRVFVALGIPNVGKKTARLIANLISNNVSVISSETIVESRYPAQSDTEQDFSLRSTSLEMTEQQQRLLSIMFMITEEELVAVKDIWPETAHAFVEYMEANRELVERLIGELDIPLPERNPQSLRDSSFVKELIGKSFCVTGSFEGISRDQIHELIEQHGGEVRTAVTSKLDYLIVGSDAGSKKSKAESLGVKCIGIEELQWLIYTRTAP